MKSSSNSSSNSAASCLDCFLNATESIYVISWKSDAQGEPRDERTWTRRREGRERPDSPRDCDARRRVAPSTPYTGRARSSKVHRVESGESRSNKFRLARQFFFRSRQIASQEVPVSPLSSLVRSMRAVKHKGYQNRFAIVCISHAESPPRIRSTSLTPLVLPKILPTLDLDPSFSPRIPIVS
jgi:hypothetical protein